MAWAILIGSGVFESVWAIALGASEGFKRKLPTTVFVVALIISMVGLAYAMVDIPTGTAYSVWIGVGATLTAAWSFVNGIERVTVVRVALITVLIASVIGLKVVS